MANKMYIEYRMLEADDVGTESRVATFGAISNKKTLEIPLTTDIAIETRSEWFSFGDFIPSFVSNILNVMNAMSSAGGSISSSFANFMNSTQMPMWQKTPPAEIATQIGFFTKTDSYVDVVKPVTEIVGLSILSRDPDNTKQYILPGMNLKNLRKFTSGTGIGEVGKKSKIVCLEIPGIVYLPFCIVKSAIPTFSNELTEQGFPLWATIDIQIMGASVGSTDMFTSAHKSERRKNLELDNYFARVEQDFL